MSNTKMINRGFTLVEMLVTVLVASIVILGISGVMADSHKSYNQMYKRVHGDIVTDAYFARIKFDKICRMARQGSAIIDISVPSLRVLYYGLPNINGSADREPDKYAKFYLNTTNLAIDTGSYDPNTGTLTQSSTEIIARNVAELKFSAPDIKSLEMIMTLDEKPADNSDYSTTITCGSVMHN